jgi:hypothetical protein
MPEMRNCFNTNVTFLNKINIHPILGIKNLFENYKKLILISQKGVEQSGRVKMAAPYYPRSARIPSSASSPLIRTTSRRTFWSCQPGMFTSAQPDVFCYEEDQERNKM